MLGYELIHFDRLAVKEFICELIRCEFLFFRLRRPLACNKVDIDRFIERELKPPQAAVAANLQCPFDRSGNSYMVGAPVKIQDDVYGAEKLEVEGVARWNEQPQPILIPVEPQSAS